MSQVIPKPGTEQRKSTADCKDSVRVFRRGQLTEILPPVPGLDKEFWTIAHEGRAGQSSGFEIVRMADPLVWSMSESPEFTNPQDYMQTFAGLEEPVCEFIQAAGYEVELTGNRPAKLGEPAWSALGGKTGDRRLLRMVQNNERGLIRYSPEKVNLAWLIAQIALVWPRERIVVVATRQHDAEFLAKAIRRYVSGVSLVTTKHHPRKAKRIAVVVQSQLRQMGVRAEKRTILVSANPPELLNDTPMLHAKEWLPKLGCRMFGFLPEKIAVAPRMEDLMAALFGSKRIFIPRHGFHDLPVRVLSLPVRAGRRSPSAAPKAGEDVFAAKRDEVWNKDLRNRWIAGLARAISENDDQALARKYRSVAKGLFSQLGGRVGVLVDNVEHAAKLLERLPDWPIVSSPTALNQSLSAKVRAAIEAGQDKSRSGFEDVIVTPSAMSSAGVFDVLIRADAGTGLLPLSDSFFVAGDLTGKRLVLVDVDDKHHPHLRQRSHGRERAYMERGWTVEGERLFRSPDERCSPTESDRRTVFRIGYLSAPSNTNTASAATRAYGKRQQRRNRKRSGNIITLKQIAQPEYLYECFQHLRQHGGPAPGLDGIRYRELSSSEWGDISQSISKALLRFAYRPQPTRKTPIPKPGTTEQRILSLGSACDRIVALAIHRTLEPHLDQLFLAGSWGFRSGRGVWQMLADLKRTVEETGRWVLAIDDVRKAFDNVPIDKLLEAMVKAQEDLKETNDPVKINDSVLKLIAVIAKGTTQDRTLGLDQGNNISPTALNVVLHYVHDLPLTAAVSNPFWYRYADNLVYPCQNVSEGQQMLDRVGELLHKSGLTLKGKDGVTDLRKNPAKLLGFQIREKNGSLTLSAGQPAWDALEEHLKQAHEVNSPLQVANEATMGWINAFGPAFEKGKPVVTRLCRLLNRYGFHEISRGLIEAQVTEAWGRWEEML